jgi:hypothetical protein
VVDSCGQSNVFSGSIMSMEFFDHVIAFSIRQSLFQYVSYLLIHFQSLHNKRNQNIFSYIPSRSKLSRIIRLSCLCVYVSACVSPISISESVRRFSRKLVRALRHWMPPQRHIFYFPIITNNNMADKRNCKFGSVVATLNFGFCGSKCRSEGKTDNLTVICEPTL